MNIFAFWEPRESIPAYLRLCLNTWKKFIPCAEIHIIDFENILDYIDVRKYGEQLFSGYFTLPQIADAIRAMLLEKYGGLWMDIDTIILKNDFNKYTNLEKDISFFGYPQEKDPHICWINAKPHTDILKYWIDMNTEKINEFNQFKIDENFWSYLGNSVVNPYIQIYPEQVEIIDVIREKCMPENNLGLNYVDFYFNKNYHLKDMDSTMLLLHNSWTPIEYKKMSEFEVLKLDCTMSNILREIL